MLQSDEPYLTLCQHIHHGALIAARKLRKYCHKAPTRSADSGSIRRDSSPLLEYSTLACKYSGQLLLLTYPAPRKRPVQATRTHPMLGIRCSAFEQESTQKELTPNADSGRVAVAESIPRPSPGWCARRNPASHLQRTLKKKLRNYVSVTDA